MVTTMKNFHLSGTGSRVASWTDWPQTSQVSPSTGRSQVVHHFATIRLERVL